MGALTLATIGLASVAIELPTEADEAARSRVVESCESVLGESACVEAASDTEATWLATIEWEGRQLTVTLLKPEREQVAKSELRFASEDGAGDRWVTAGLTVAALTVAQQHAPSKVETARPVAPSPSPNRPVDRVGGTPAKPVRLSSPRSTSSLALDLRTLVGQGLDAGVLRWGGSARISWFASARAPGVGVGVRAATTAQDPKLRWIDGSLSMLSLLRGRSSRWRVTLAGEAVLQWAEAQGTLGGEQQTAGTWRGGGRIGMGLSYQLARGVSLWAGGDMTLLRPRLEIQFAGRRIGEEGLVRWCAGLGTTVLLSKGHR